MGRKAVSDRTQPISISLKKSVAEDFRSYCEVIGKTPSQIVSEYIDELLQPYRDVRTGRVRVKKALYIESEESIPKLCYMISDLGIAPVNGNADSQTSRLGSYLINLQGDLRKVPADSVTVMADESDEPER